MIKEIKDHTESQNQEQEITKKKIREDLENSQKALF